MATSVWDVNLKNAPASRGINKLRAAKFYRETDGREVHGCFTVFIINEALDEESMGAVD